MAYTFRVRFKLSRVRIQSEAAELRINNEADGRGSVTLRPRDSGVELGDADELVLTGEPYASDQAAVAAARRWVTRLRRAFARLNIGADFGGRAHTGAFTDAGLRWLEEMTGERRMLNDVHGIMVFESEPAPKFAKTGVTAVVGKPGERVIEMVEAAVRLDVAMTEREELAYDLYSASFSEQSADARFVMLMMAAETLIEPQPRSQEVAALVGELIATTERSSLPPDEITSIIGSLKWLYSESIGQAGRRLAESLGDRRYAEEEPRRFFTRCYDLRSKLVHGYHPRPERGEVDALAATLEVFVSDLLAGALRDESPR
jgi:hypothetical protein